MTLYIGDKMTKPMYATIMPVNWGIQKPLPFGALTKEEQRRRMLGSPPIVSTNVYYPTLEEKMRMAQKGIADEVHKIVEQTDANGGVIKLAVNGNDEVVGVEKTNNFIPLAIAAAIAFAFLGG